MRENLEGIGTSLPELLSEGSRFREGCELELIDYVLTKEMGVDFTKLYIPRIMGFLRQLRVEAEINKSKMRGVDNGN